MAQTHADSHQCNHFLRYAKDYNEYAVKRYQDELKRLYKVLDKHLEASDSEYLVGNKCTIVCTTHGRA